MTIPGIDWAAFREGLGGIASSDAADVRRLKSRDFFWYSPILSERLRECLADLVVTPSDEAEVIRILAAAAEAGAPVTVRGAGTGNYGQAVPLHGGVVLETVRLNRVLGVGDGWLRAECGARLEAIDRAALAAGQELLMYPSTKRSATLGGFVAGGSAGIGSVRHGMLKDPGVLRWAKVITCEPRPRVLELRGAEILQVHHAYGTNGVITELEIGLAPATPWVHCLIAADDYLGAVRLAKAVDASGVVVQLLSCIEERIVPLIKPLRSKLPGGKHLLLAIVAESSMAGFLRLVSDHGATAALCGSEADLRRNGLPAITEFSYNHTTLQALKVDPSITYLQTLFPAPIDEGAIRALMTHFGDELLWHHEFVRFGGAMVAFAIQIVRYTTAARLMAIIDEIEGRGFPVFNPHTYVLEDGGMKQVDPRHIALKRVADPYGLMNPGKTRGWDGPNRWAEQSPTR